MRNERTGVARERNSLCVLDMITSEDCILNEHDGSTMFSLAAALGWE